jgi:hypothetical protein
VLLASVTGIGAIVALGGSDGLYAPIAIVDVERASSGGFLPTICGTDSKVQN